MVSECSYLTDYTCEEGRLFWLNTINFRGKVKTDTFSINTNIWCFWVNGCVRRYSLLFVYICIAHYQKGLDLRSHLQVKPTIFRVYRGRPE
jgi:hypothetical protein